MCYLVYLKLERALMMWTNGVNLGNSKSLKVSIKTTSTIKTSGDVGIKFKAVVRRGIPKIILAKGILNKEITKIMNFFI